MIFGAACKQKIATLPDGTADFSTFFNNEVQYGLTPTAAMIANGCDEMFAANWRKLVKRDIINCGGRLPMIDFMTRSFPSVVGDTQRIPAKNKYFKSTCAINYNISAAASASGIKGQNVTFQISRADHSANGKFDPLSIGQRLLLKDGGNTMVTVIAVNKDVPYAHTATVHPTIDYAVNIVANKPMMVVPTKQVSTYSCHTPDTRLATQGHIYKMSMKSIRAGWSLPLDTMLHCDQMQFALGIDPNTGLEIPLWTTLAREDARAGMLLTKHTDILFGTKSDDQVLIDNCMEGFNGLTPSIRFGGGNVLPWDPIYGLNPRTDLRIIISNADQQKSFKEYYVVCGFEYFAEMQDQLRLIIGDNPGSCSFQAFNRAREWDKQSVELFQITSYKVLGYTFHFYVADAFSDSRIIGGQQLSNTAYYYPTEMVKDSAGNSVAPLEMYTFDVPGWDGGYKEITRSNWEIDGCLSLAGDMIESYGMVTHCLKDWYLHAPKPSC